ncbi:SRPBCC domain-containing protein [Paenibacillus sp. MSJ-34]|uniref:SRPBCC domain-containing protein n=1 Tax=Paenibacillus sp. MSJ-34 TaxID=2841529 RepID=UPI0034605D1A
MPENYSIITFSLYEQDNMTVLKLKQSDFATLSMYEHSDKNWEATLDIIKQLSEKESFAD